MFDYKTSSDEVIMSYQNEWRVIYDHMIHNEQNMLSKLKRCG